MDRIIKFRGKDLDWGQKWRYGDLDHVVEEKWIRERHENGWFSYKSDPATVGQFTGLLDRDGREIYEGDIIGFHLDGSLYLVEWNGDYAGFYYRLPGYMGNDLSTYEAAECTIAGNIHDNPELLNPKS